MIRALHEMAYWGSGTALFAFLAAALYPGLMDHDSLFQLVQLRADMLNNLHPPIMAYLWQLAEQLEAGPGGLFAVHWAAYALGALLIAHALFASIWQRFAVIALLAFCPPLLSTLVTVWKDAGLIAALMLATGCLLQHLRRAHPLWLGIALVMLLYAAAVRHNAIPAILPLLWFLLWRAHIAHGFLKAQRRGRAWLLACFMLAGVLVYGSVQMLNRYGVQQHIDPFPSVAVWDLAAISLEADTLLIPRYALHGGHITLARLRQLFSPTNNVPLCRFTPGLGREVYCLESMAFRRGSGLSPYVMPTLRREWREAIMDQPMAYLHHRARVTCHLLDWCRTQGSLGFNSASIQPKDFAGAGYNGPPLRSLGLTGFDEPSASGKALIERLIWLRERTGFMSGWPYLLVLLSGTILVGWTQPPSPLREAGRCLALSGWLLALPLFFIAPNMHLRYLVWPVASALLCVLIWLTMPRQKATAA